MPLSNLSPSAFAAYTIQRWAAVAEPTDFEFDEHSFPLVRKDGLGRPSVRLSLANVYRTIKQASVADRLRILDDFILHSDALPSPTADFETAREHIYPCIRDRWEIEKLNTEMQMGLFGPPAQTCTQSVPYDTFGDVFAITHVIDSGQRWELVTSAHLESWGISDETLSRQADINLQQYEFLFEILKDKQGAPMVGLSAGDFGLHASRALYPMYMDNLRPGQMPVVALADRDSMMLTWDWPGMLIMVHMAYLSEQNTGGRPLPPIPLQYEDNLLVNFRRRNQGCRNELPSLFRDLAQLEIRYLANIYAEQATVLSSRADQMLHDVALAAFTPVINRHEEYTSLCTSINGQPTLLPRTDFVSLTNAKGDVLALSSWERFSHLLASDLVQIEAYPERYLLNKALTVGQLSWLGTGDLD